MPQVLIRAAGLFKRWPVVLVAVLLAGGGSALVALPLLGLPGFELSAALALAQGFLGCAAGIAAARQERRMISGADPRPAKASRSDNALTSTLLATLAAFTVNAACLVPPLLVSVVYALVSTSCDPFAAVGFVPLLPFPSALVAASVGVACGFATRRWWSATMLYLLCVIASGLVTAWPIVFGPQVFAFNHFAGHLPGPLYDEALSVTPSLLWFRLESALLVIGVVSVVALLLDMRTGTFSRPHVRVGSALLLVAISFGIFTLEERAAELGTRMTERSLKEKLAGLRETEHVVLHHPRGLPKEEQERLLRDLEFRHHQISEFFGGAPEGKVHVWWYRSAAEKKALVGASGTQFAKPWRREVHVNAMEFPHPVVKHELVHALAAPFGAPPFGVTARFFGLFPNAAVIEGLAVAADNPVDELTLHQWAAGMKSQKLLPDLRALLQPTGFYSAAAGRAYTAAGSFFRWLGDTHGGAKLREVYRDGDLPRVYGQPVTELVSAWEKFLDEVPLDPEAVNQAFARFRRGSLFQRACAREVVQLANEAAELLESDPETAIVRYGRCAALQPDEAGYVLGQVRAYVKTGRKAEALDVLSALAEKVKDQPAVLAEVAMAASDLAREREKPDEAKEKLEQIIALKVSPAMDRTARVKLAALADPVAGPTLWAYFTPGKEDVKLLVLHEGLAKSPDNPWLQYLLGRRLTQSGAPGLAAPFLEAALTKDLPESLRREASKLSIEAHFLAGDCASVKHLVSSLPGFGAAFSARAQEWADRCEFEEKVFSSILVPVGPLR